jgi:cell division protein FtsI (penicillin-binding protein 3)
VNSTRGSRRRLAVAIIAVFAVVAVFVVRLVDIQLVRADELTTEAKGKRAIEVTVAAPRGDIVDTNGHVLAGSVIRYDVTADPSNISDFTRKNKDGSTTPVTVMEAAGEIAALTGQTQNDVFIALTEDPEANWALITKSVDTETMRAIRKLAVPGIYFENRPTRTYPDGQVAGNLVGFMGTDGPQNGLEATEKECLASTAGSLTYERGADGVQIPGSSVTTKEAVPGGTVKLTIDRDLNWFAQQAIAEQAIAIGAESAAAVVVRVKDGHLMAVADWPTVDPNDVNATAEKDQGSLGSKAFTAQYEPGSVFKGMSAAMIIDSGIGSPTSPATVPSSWKTPEGGTVRDAGAHAVQRLTLTGILQTSSNVGISMLGNKVPTSTRYDYMKKFGLGERTAVDFQGEETGYLPKSWDDQTRYNVLYGQGVSATAVQVAGIYQTLGNDGVRLPLTLVESCTMADGTVVTPPPSEGVRAVSQSSAETTVNMLESVVQAGELSKVVKIPGYRVAGKSGTAEVAVNGRYGTDRIVSFVGVAPAEDPEYVVLVTFTKPATIKTSAAAAPTFNKIMTQVLTKYRVPPSTTPSTYPATTW